MIATVCDEGEFLQKVTRPAIQSFARWMPDAPFCLVLINGSGRYDAAIRSWHPRLILKNYPLEIRDEFLRGYQFCYMTLPLHDLLTEFDEPLIYVDADTLLRGRLDPVYELLERYDLVVRYLPFQAVRGPTTEQDGARINNGCLGIANNAATKRYTAALRCRVIDYLESGRDPSLRAPTIGTATGLDQELLWVIYREMRDALRFFPLDDRFNDSQMHDDSVLWHAKGTARRNPRYLFEVARIDGDRSAMLRQWPKKCAIDVFRALRTMKWRWNLCSAFRIAVADRYVAAGRGARLLVVNSCFLRCNPALLRFEVVECIDVDPVWFYLNQAYLEKFPNVRHAFRMPGEQWPTGKFDLVIADRRVSDVRAGHTILQASDGADDLKWRRTRLIGRPAAARAGGSRAAGATMGAKA